MRHATGLLLAVLALSAAPVTRAQTAYAGTLGKQPVQLVLYAYSDGVVVAAYAYDRFDTPIRVDGRVANGALELHENDAAQHPVATLRLAPFAADSEALRGTWSPADGSTAQPQPIALHRQFTVGAQEGPEVEEVELLQAASTADHYFKVATAGNGRANAVVVYGKRTDALVQRIAVDTEWRGIDSVQVGDFDFDGAEDFSLFESSYAGPNTSSLYFLRDAATGRYVATDWAGTSLEFDAASQRVHEHNQCCAGRSHMNATYRVEGRKLVLEDKQCTEFDDATQDYVDTPCD